MPRACSDPVRPFFSYFGGKWTVAGYLGRPRQRLVIEPFAGSACYATRWNARRVRLYDVSPDICSLWDFLISCSEADLAAIPDRFEDFAQIERLAPGPQMLVRFWTGKGRAHPGRTLSPWYHEFKDSGHAQVWGPTVKARLIAQKPLLADWSIDCLPWDRVPVTEAHWHIDPPYSGPPGRKYPFDKIDYPALAEWVRALPGSVDACENEGATWLPFQPLCEVVTSRGRRSGAVSSEAVWRKV